MRCRSYQWAVVQVLSTLGVLVAILAGALPAAAREGDPMAEGGERHLNGHGFLTSLYVQDPFVASSFRNHTGGGMAMDLKTPFRNLDGDVIYTLQGDLFFASLGMGYQQKIGSRWAIGGELSGLVRSGTNAASFLTEGADVDRQGRLWAKYRLMRTEKSQVSLGVDWSYSKVLYFTPGDFARYIADGGSLEDAPLVVSEKVWTTRLVASWAHAFSPMFGLRVNGGFGLYEEPGTTGVSKASHRVGVLGEMDLKHKYSGFPLGVTLGFTQALPDNDPFTGQSGTLLGFWYTGKESFVLGVEMGFMKLAIANQETEKVKSMFGVFTMRYYF